MTLTMGAFRTWRSQNAIVRGKAISGGYEIVSLAAGIFVVSDPALADYPDTITLLTATRDLIAALCSRYCR